MTGSPDGPIVVMVSDSVASQGLPGRFIDIRRSTPSVLSFDGGYFTTILVDGEAVAELGVNCGTCEIFFRALSQSHPLIMPPEQLTRRVSDTLNEGKDLLNPDLLTDIAQLFPAGRYQAVSLRLRPQRIEAGSDSDPLRVSSFAPLVPSHLDISGVNLGHYYLTQGWTPEVLPFQFERMRVHRGLGAVQPIQTSLNPDRVKHYEKQFSERRQPAALAVLNWSDHVDIHGVDQGRTTTLLHLTLLDGHHKMQAAANQNVSLPILAFWQLHAGEVTPVIAEWTTNVLPRWQALLAHYDSLA